MVTARKLYWGLQRIEDLKLSSRLVTPRANSLVSSSIMLLCIRPMRNVEDGCKERDILVCSGQGGDRIVSLYSLWNKIKGSNPVPCALLNRKLHYIQPILDTIQSPYKITKYKNIRLIRIQNPVLTGVILGIAHCSHKNSSPIGTWFVEPTVFL